MDPASHIEAHAKLKASVAHANLPPEVKAALLHALQTGGPIALDLAVKVLEAAFPSWAVVLEAIKLSLMQLIPQPAPAS